MANSTKYTRITSRFEVSEDSGYTDVLQDLIRKVEEDDWDQYKVVRVSAATGGTTIDLGEFSTVGKMVVFNLDTSNYVTAVFRNGDTGASDITVRALAGGSFDTGGNITVANDLVLTANGAACECVVLIFGAA